MIKKIRNILKFKHTYSNDSIINNTGVTIIESLISIAIVAIGVKGVVFFVNGNLNSGLSIESNQTKSYIYQDIYNSLSDERNCAKSFEGVVFNGSPLSDPIQISKITHKSGAKLFEAEANCYDRSKESKSKSRLNKINSMTLSSRYIYPSNTMKAHARLALSLGVCNTLKEGFKVSKTKNINITFLLKQVGANKVVDRCWASGGFSSSSVLPSNCEKGSVLVSENGKFVCSSDLPGAGISSSFTKLPCNPIANGSAHTTFLGSKCATLTTNETSDPLRSDNPLFVVDSGALTYADGVLLHSESYTAKTRSKLFIEATIPVYSDFGNIATNRFEAAFLASVWIKRKNQSPLNFALAGVGMLYNPFSTPSFNGASGGFEYFDEDSQSRFFSFSPDDSAGRPGYVTAEADLEADVEYDIRFKVLSVISGTGHFGHTLNPASILPIVSFGSIKHNDIFSEAYIKYSEASR